MANFDPEEIQSADDDLHVLGPDTLKELCFLYNSSLTPGFGLEGYLQHYFIANQLQAFPTATPVLSYVFPSELKGLSPFLVL